MSPPAPMHSQVYLRGFEGVGRYLSLTVVQFLNMGYIWAIKFGVAFKENSKSNDDGG